MEEGEIPDKSTKVVESECVWVIGLERKKDGDSYLMFIITLLLLKPMYIVF